MADDRLRLLERELHVVLEHSHPKPRSCSRARWVDIGTRARVWMHAGRHVDARTRHDLAATLKGFRAWAKTKALIEAKATALREREGHRD